MASTNACRKYSIGYSRRVLFTPAEMARRGISPDRTGMLAADLAIRRRLRLADHRYAVVQAARYDAAGNLCIDVKTYRTFP